MLSLKKFQPIWFSRLASNSNYMLLYKCSEELYYINLLFSTGMRIFTASILLIIIPQLVNIYLAGQYYTLAGRWSTLAGLFLP